MLSNSEWKGLWGEVDLCTLGATPPPANITGNLCPAACMTWGRGFGVLTPKQRCSVQPLTFSNFFWSSHPLLPLPQPQKPKVCGMGSFCFWELLSVFPPAVILAKSFFQVSGWLFSSLWLFLDNLCPGSVFARADLLHRPCCDGKTERTVLYVAPQSCSALEILE